MAKQIQLRRGTTTEHNTFTGAVGELTYDTEKKQLRVHDGSTVGGKVLADTQIDVTGQVENATETTAGKAKIATTAIVQAGTNDTDFLTAKKLKENTIAFGVDWIDVSSSRAVNTNYVNTLPRAIIVRICFFIAAQSTFTSLEVDGKARDQAGSQQWATNSFVALSAEVPSGKTFRFDVPTGSVSQILWCEL